MSIVMEDGEGVVDGRRSVRLCRSLAAAGQSIQLDAPRCVPGAGAHPSIQHPSSKPQPIHPPHQPPHPYPGRLPSPAVCLARPTHSTMDSLVAQYSQAPHQNEGYGHEEQQELMEVTPPLSLKFALPPVAAVCSHPLPLSAAHRHTDCVVSLHHGSAP